MKIKLFITSFTLVLFLAFFLMALPAMANVNEDDDGGCGDEPNCEDVVVEETKSDKKTFDASDDDFKNKNTDLPHDFKLTAPGGPVPEVPTNPGTGGGDKKDKEKECQDAYDNCMKDENIDACRQEITIAAVGVFDRGVGKSLEDMKSFGRLSNDQYFKMVGDHLKSINESAEATCKQQCSDALEECNDRVEME